MLSLQKLIQLFLCIGKYNFYSPKLVTEALHIPSHNKSEKKEKKKMMQLEFKLEIGCIVC